MFIGCSKPVTNNNLATAYCRFKIFRPPNKIMISQASFFIFISNLSKFMFNLPLYLCYFIRACTRSVIQTFNRKEKCLNGETVLITGAASGIGRHVTYLLAKRFPDAKYILWDINQAELNTTTAHCQKLGAITVHTYVVNLSNLKEIKDTAARVKSNSFQN